MVNSSFSDSDNEDERTKALIEAVGDFAIVRISPEGIIESWNTGAERITGYTADEIIGRPLSVLYSEEDQQTGQPLRGLRIAEAEGRFEDEASRIRKDGHRFRARIVIDPIRNTKGQLIGFAKITHDVTAHYELEQTKERLIRAQKFEIVGRLTGGMSHDFNNLLTSILGCLDLIGHLTNDERIERLIESGITAAARGQKLIAQLLAFARKQMLWPQRTQVNDLIEVLQPLLSQAGGDAVPLHVDLDKTLGEVDLDQGQFQSALLNLALNARDAMPKGGLLTVRTRRVVAEAGAEANGAKLAARNYVAVEIEDSGAGMSQEVRERAIEPFFTTKDVGLGSGLGLSQAYGFALQSGGDLQIESTPGVGTIVRLLLPEPIPQVEAAYQPAPPPRRAVLLVEDDPEVLRIAVEMLKACNYEIYTAEDAEQALTVLQREIPIDVLFTDIVMPGGMNGVDLARQAIHLRPNLSVLLTSGYARDALRARHGIGDEITFLQKPYRLSTLDSALNRLLKPSPDSDPDDDEQR